MNEWVAKGESLDCSCSEHGVYVHVFVCVHVCVCVCVAPCRLMQVILEP